MLKIVGGYNGIKIRFEFADFLREQRGRRDDVLVCEAGIALIIVSNIQSHIVAIR